MYMYSRSRPLIKYYITLQPGKWKHDAIDWETETIWFQQLLSYFPRGCRWLDRWLYDSDLVIMYYALVKYYISVNFWDSKWFVKLDTQLLNPLQAFSHYSQPRITQSEAGN